MTDPDVVDDGGSFALSGLWVPDQIVPGTENPPAEREVLIRGTGQTQTGVFSHSVDNNDTSDTACRTQSTIIIIHNQNTHI